METRKVPYIVDDSKVFQPREQEKLKRASRLFLNDLERRRRRGGVTEFVETWNPHRRERAES